MAPDTTTHQSLPPQLWASGPIRAVITGSSGGIGKAIVQLLLSADHNTVSQIITLDRDPEQVFGLPLDKRLVRLGTDFGDADSYHCLHAQLRQHTTRIHLVINCIGLLHADDIKPEKSLAQVELPQLHALFAANAYPVLMLAQALQGLLKHDHRSVFASLSARVGSIADNQTGGWYGYRASKAAHNMFIKTLSLEWRFRLPQCTCVALHPGTVDTFLSKPFVTTSYSNTVHSPEAAALNLLQQTGQLKPEDSGSFLAWDGERLPW